MVEARAHVNRCELCRRFFEDMRRVSERIGAAAPRPHAPVEMRDRLFKAVALARAGPSAARGATPWRRRVGLGLVATVLLAGTWLGYLATRSGVAPAADALSSIVEDHVRARSPIRLVSSDSLEVAHWLADRLPFAVQVPIFPEARLKGARLVLVNHQTGAVVEYAIGGEPLSYYVLPTSSRDPVAPRQIRVTERLGYHLATWEDAGLAHALVAVLPAPKLLALARYCIHRMMAELGTTAKRCSTA
jgi:anti-sigma factor RsiW